MQTRILDLIVVCSFIWWFLFLFRLEFKFEEQWVFFCQGFLSRKLTGQQGKGGDHLLFHSTTSTRSRTFRHLFATLHVRWLSHIFNRTTCIYQTATRWDLPPYRITIWLIDDVMLIFDWLLACLGFVTTIWHEKPVDSNFYRLSSLYYKWTN